MTKPTLLIAAMLAAAPLLAQASLAAPAKPVAAAPAGLDRGQVEEIVRTYLLDHPEVLAQALAKLEEVALQRRVTALRPHLAGLDRLLRDQGSRTFCLGTGHGFSVREVISAAARVTNRAVPVVEGPRRPGDAVRLVCGSLRARQELGWEPTRSTLAQMISDAHRWAEKQAAAKG